MKRLNYLLVAVILVVNLNSYSMQEAGLIFYNLDTIAIPREKGFDFVTQTACTSYTEGNCVLHFDMNYYAVNLKYTIFVHNGYSINKGKINLDSVKVAPSDSLFTGSLYVDSIPPDSLSSRIGNVYVLKTGTDPRPFYNQPFYAKIKIIKFIVVDSAGHSVKMIFLWAFNRSGYRDLTTTGLDTFHLDGTTVTSPMPNIATARVSRSASGQYVFKVIGDWFVVPEELFGPGIYFVVYDLKGKKLGTLATNGCRVIDLRQVAKGNGVFVVRVEDFFLK